MEKELIISASSEEIQLALVEDKQLVELHKDKPGNTIQVGDIFVGKVRKIMPGLNAAFINVGEDKDGFVHDKLLEFHFGSSFTALKDKFRTNAYVFSESSVLISRSEAEKMLQAVEYILSENYSREFEDILNNEYVDLLGNGFSRFDDRFIKSRDKMYVEKDCDGWTVSFGDYQWDVETHECDEEIKSNLKRVRTCLRAFLDAECCSWDGHELVLEYSTYD